MHLWAPLNTRFLLYVTSPPFIWKELSPKREFLNWKKLFNILKTLISF